MMDGTLRYRITKAPQCMFLADDVVQVRKSVEELSVNLEALMKDVKEKRLRVNRKKIEFMIFSFSSSW